MILWMSHNFAHFISLEEYVIEEPYIDGTSYALPQSTLTTLQCAP